MASYRDVIGALEALVRLVRRSHPDSAILHGSTFGHAEQVIREARRGVNAPVAWTPFERRQMREGDAASAPGAEVWVNSRYLVLRTAMPNGFVYLSVKRHDQAAIRDWRDLQRIKNDLVGPECEGMELFPAESRKLDQANQYHLWVAADPMARLMVGDTDGRVVEGPAPGDGHGQEPFEPGDPYGPERAA